jgi:hypothetical protein
MAVKGFVFSFDAVFALAFVVSIAVVIVLYTPAIPYSKMQQYELHRYADTSLSSLLRSGDINSALDKVFQGQTNAAKNMLKGKLLDLYGQRYNKAISLQVFYANMTQAVDFRASHPADVYPNSGDMVAVVRTTFVYKDMYGIATLQIW